MASEGESAEVILFSTLSILQIIKDAQQQHGLRHGDYQRYRGYCSRKVRRVRKSLKFTHTHKSVPKHPAKFQSKKVTKELVVEARFLLVPLFEAERCWAYGMQLKQELTAEEAPRKKFHFLSRLRKAAQHASLLDALARSLPQVDAQTKLEAQAYSSWMQGSLAFEMKQWNGAIEAFNSAKRIYEKLGAVVVEEGLRVAYRGRCAEMQPQLRYAAYSVGDDSAMSDLVEMRMAAGPDAMSSDLDKLIAQTLEIQGRSVKAEAVWAGHTISLASPPKLHAFFNSLNQFEKDRANAPDFDTKMSLYEKLLIECRDAIQAVRDEAKNENLKAGVVDGELSPALLTHSYLSFVLSSLTLQRYLLMILHTRKGSEGKKARAQDLVRLYDTVLQNLTDIQALPGIDAAFKSATQTLTTTYKAFRCFYVGEAYAGLKKWAEALALFERALERAADASVALRKKPYAAAFPNIKISEDEVKGLVEKVNAAKHKAYASSLSSAQGENTQTALYDKALLDDLETYRKWNSGDVVSGKTGGLVSLPPDFLPMPCKPLFFDLALNHLKFPSLEAKMDLPPSPPTASSRPDSEQPQDPKAGLSGVLKGWFWGSGK